MNEHGHEIVVESEFHTAEELDGALRAAIPDSQGDIKLRLNNQESAFRVDPTVLVALVGGSAVAMAALITGVFTLAGQFRKVRGHVVLKLADGRAVDVPEGTPIEEIERLLKIGVTKVILQEKV